MMVPKLLSRVVTGAGANAGGEGGLRAGGDDDVWGCLVEGAILTSCCSRTPSKG